MSPIYRDLYGTSIRDDHWEKMNGMNFVWTTDGLTQDRLNQAYREILNGFYRQHRVGKNYARLTLKNPGRLLRVGRFLAGMVASRVWNRLSRRRGRAGKGLVSLD